MWRQSTQMEKRSKGGGVRVCRKKKKNGFWFRKTERILMSERERKKERKRERVKMQRDK